MKEEKDRYHIIMREGGIIPIEFPSPTKLIIQDNQIFIVKDSCTDRKIYAVFNSTVNIFKR